MTAGENIAHIAQALQNIEDWLLGDGVTSIHKNQDWRSIVSASNKWHEKIALSRLNQKDVVYWEPLVGKIQKDEFVATELCSSKELYLEGYKLKHCVQTYYAACHSKNYIVFNLKKIESENSYEEATLGVSLHDHKPYLDQVRGYHNGTPSESLSQFAQLVFTDVKARIIDLHSLD